MRLLWGNLSNQSRRLIGFCAVLLLTTVVAVFLTVMDLRRAMLRAADQNIHDLGIAIAEHTSRSLQAVDLVLQSLQDQATQANLATPDDFKRAMQTDAQRLLLKVRTDNLPQVNAFAIVAADGDVVASSHALPAMTVNGADRDWYRYLRDHDDRGAFLSDPVFSRATQKWVMFLARRVSGRSGQFLGVVLGVIDLAYFAEFYKSVSDNNGMSVSLRTRAGMALTRYPVPVSPGDQLPPGREFFHAVAQGSGIYRASNLQRPGDWIISVHPLPDYPVVVSVTISEDYILSFWRQEALLIAAGTAGAIVCVLLLLRALAQQFRRLETQAKELSASQASLSDRTIELQTTLDHINQGLIMVKADRVVSVCNRRAIEMLDLPTDLMASHPLYEVMMAHQSAKRGFNSLETAFPDYSGTALVFDVAHTYERVRPNGTILEIQSTPLEGGGMVRTFTDITARRRSERQIRELAYHDGLTSLLNRHAFQERLLTSIETTAPRACLAVLYLDLDRFKSVNDTRGHAIGDKLLAEVAVRMRSVVRETDIVARMGGDEFAIIQSGVHQPRAATQIAQRLVEVVGAPYDIDGTPCLIGLSIGIALFPKDGGTADELLRNADTALYRAKSDGRGTFRLFDESMDARLLRMFQLEQALRDALEKNELALAYQPIVDAGSRDIRAFEALLRWNQSGGGSISPLEFIPLAEMSGLIVPIGLWVLETACAEAASWDSDVRISVNLSPVQFRRDNLITQVRRVLEKTGLAPDRLSLEITEGVLLDGTAEVLGTMASLRDLGVRFSLDDFGTAHAGLSYLRSFPFDALKIDKSFVQDAVTRPESRAIVEAILAMGSALKLTVIAEGVETEEQLKLLKQMQCQQVQGYLTGAPVSAAETRALVAKPGQRTSGPIAALRSIE